MKICYAKRYAKLVKIFCKAIFRFIPSVVTTAQNVLKQLYDLNLMYKIFYV